MSTAARTTDPFSLAEVLGIHPIGGSEFIGPARPTAGPRILGGVTVAQALLAAWTTVPDGRPVHCLQSTFLRPGYSDTPVTYRVHPLYDGTSYTTRMVSATQRERTIFTGTVSFQEPESGPSHQVPELSAPAPAKVAPAAQMWKGDRASLSWLAAVERTTLLEYRFPVTPTRVATAQGTVVPPWHQLWVRPRTPTPGDDRMQAATLAYITDVLLLSTALGPHRITTQDPGLRFATVNHSIWFHSPCRVDDWLLYEQEGTWAGSGRALCRGSIFLRDGTLAATVTQEGMIRTSE
ncbi:acyl-CoA thioesterase [Nocardia jinanensis]|uniref:Acyl-CoA thioesterase II n=1 Tax=Nocardia jinanensis TaxID=382504 RepID=A0A917RLM4_9NOCA|nr:acyl-CoA thioesterase domain-containing protein [Nocardia jinanensis]GGL12886.1 acyl-CoA thioesterase II [Nocardia jinanensis]